MRVGLKVIYREYTGKNRYKIGRLWQARPDRLLKWPLNIKSARTCDQTFNKPYFDLCIIRFVPGPGLVSTSPAIISSCFLRRVVRREGARSPTVPLPLGIPSEEERWMSILIWRLTLFALWELLILVWSMSSYPTLLSFDPLPPSFTLIPPPAFLFPLSLPSISSHPSKETMKRIVANEYISSYLSSFILRVIKAWNLTFM